METIERMRVRVWDGRGEKDLGPGWLIGNTTVYAFRHSSGHLVTQTDPTQEPPNELVIKMEAEGYRLDQLDANPVIELDSGQTVYGSQVWWERQPTDRPGPKGKERDG